MTATRTITVLFTDVAGSTVLLGSLGPAAAEEVRSRHFSGMRDALAVHRGREVKTLGDGFMAVFDSAVDAVACAVTMQRDAARQTRSLDGRVLGLRVGISTGEAAEEEGDYFGMTVVEASRLCAAARPGQILAGQIVRLLAGGSGLHRLVPAGDLSLKGLPDPTPAWEVDWDSDEDVALRVAIADDSRLLRAGIAQVLTAEGLDVVLEADDAESLFEQLAAAAPHVVLLDVRMPPTHTTEGLEAAERVRREHPEIGVLVLSAHVDATTAARVLGCGSEGVGYLLKERIADPAELVAAIRTVAGGGSAMDPEVVGLLPT